MVCIISWIFYLYFSKYSRTKYYFFFSHISGPTDSERYPNAVVASDSLTCSQIGTNTLINGGNAVDAAIAVALCLGVVSPFASGIGGGGFMLIHNATTKTQTFLDFREVAPLAATPDMFNNNPNGSISGGTSIAVPGELMGLWEAWSQFGNSTWESLFIPSIALAKSFPCSKILESRIQQMGQVTDPVFNSIFYPNGKAAVEGDIIKREAYANTLQIISQQGPSAFYNGQLTNDIVADIQANNGIITNADFNQYTVQVRTPLHGYHHGLKVVTGPPPSSGGIVLLALNLLERFPFPNMNTSARTQVIVEALKHGFGHRSLFADPNFVNNVTQNVNTIITKDYAYNLGQTIFPDKTFPSEFYLVNNQPSISGGGTTHISIIDKNKNAVSFTTTINGLFGSKVISSKLGIVYNNQMDDFSSLVPNQFGLIPSVSNQIAPGKRPLSSISPTFFIDNNKIVHCVGASGGPTIISSVLQALINAADLGMNPRLSVDALRVHDQLFPRTVTVEPGFDPTVIDYLTAIGHNVTVQTGTLFDGQHGIGNVQLATNNGSYVMGFSDPRKLGQAAGY